MGQTQPADSYCRGLEEDEIHEIGEQWRDEGVCNLKVCQEQGIISEQECSDLPEELPDPRCRIVPGKMEERFPACCPRMECPPPEEISQEEIDEMEWEDTWDKYRVERMAGFMTEDEPEGFPYYDSDHYIHLNCPYETASESE